MMEESRVEDCCRTCLRESSDMQPMSSQWNNQLQFWQMLVDITGDTNDLLYNAPDHICLQCQKRLSISYSFKKMCLESKSMLSKWLSEDEPTEDDKHIFQTSDCNHVISIVHDSGEATSDADLVGKLAITSKAYFETKLIAPKETRNEPSSDTIAETYLDDCDADYPEKKISVEIKNQGSAEKIIVAAYAATYHEVADHQKFSTLRQCLTCKLHFDDHKSYQMHHRQVHRTRTVCTECGKLISKHSMDKHMRSHTNAKEHLCTECGKSFTLGENLKKHLRIHAGDKRYTCQHCGEQFIHWNSKRSHIRTVHTGEKKYVI